MILLIMIRKKNQKVAITRLAIGIDTQVTHHVVAMEKVAKYHILTKCSKSENFNYLNVAFISYKLTMWD